MSADVLGVRFIVGDRIYFSGRTKLKLTAVDKKLGVKEIKYFIDDMGGAYSDPFYLPSKAGRHINKVLCRRSDEQYQLKQISSQHWHYIC
jgi:hypothetical protein